MKWKIYLGSLPLQEGSYVRPKDDQKKNGWRRKKKKSKQIRTTKNKDKKKHGAIGGGENIFLGIREVLS